jgi:hypothetical protein
VSCNMYFKKKCHVICEQYTLVHMIR